MTANIDGHKLKALNDDSASFIADQMRKIQKGDNKENTAMSNTG